METSAALARDVGLIPTYDLLYRNLSWFVHSAPFAAAYYLRDEGDRVEFECWPAQPTASDGSFVEVLMMSLPLGLIEALAVTDTAYNLGRQLDFDGLYLKSG
jgi:hypothetical protein